MSRLGLDFFEDYCDMCKMFTVKCVFLLSVLLTPFLSFQLAGCTKTTETIKQHFTKSTHTNNWAVLVCTSRFWFNYRHIANALSVYRSVKRLGIPDSQIILMLADDMACNPRNPRPGKVYNNKDQAIDVYGADVEVDYRGYEVTAENFIRVLTGRLPVDAPRSKRLSTDDRSNVLIYMTGHGGEDFLKFQDAEEISNVELADAFEQMWQRRRYNELLFIIDTCQAVSMFKRFYSPNIMAIASSQVGEDSLSHHVDPAIGVYIIDRYTYHLLEFLERVSPGSKKTMSQLFEVCPPQQCISTPGFSTELFARSPSETLISDFFGSVRDVDVTDWPFVAKTNPDVSASNNGTIKKDGGVEATQGRYSYTEQFVTRLDGDGESKEGVESTRHPMAGTAAAVFMCFVVATMVKTLTS